MQFAKRLIRGMVAPGIVTSLIGGVPLYAQSANAFLCNEGKTVCVAKEMSSARVAARWRIRAKIAAQDDVAVTWEVKDDTGARLASGSTWDYPEALSRKSPELQELDVVLYLLQPAKSEHGTLVLTASRLDVSSERMNSPVLSVPIHPDTATTELTFLMPADEASYDAEIDTCADEPKATDFAPKHRSSPRR